MLYSSSQVDKRKVGKLAMAIQVAFQQLGIFEASSTHIPANMEQQQRAPAAQSQLVESLDQNIAFGRLTPPMAPDPVTMSGRGDAQTLTHELQKVLAPEIQKQEVRIRQGPDGVVLSLQEIGFYDPGSDVLRPGAEAILERLVRILTSYGVRFRIEGHTDDIPIHNARFASNWELSTARATGLVRLFIDKYSVTPNRLSAAGYAEFHPVASNSTADGRRMNRRIDVVILPPLKPTQAVANSGEDSGTRGHAEGESVALASRPAVGADIPSALGEPGRMISRTGGVDAPRTADLHPSKPKSLTGDPGPEASATRPGRTARPRAFILMGEPQTPVHSGHGDTETR